MTYELIRRQLSTAVPFANHVGIELETIEKGRAVARLPFRPEGLNHIGTQHAGALFALGEAASGAAMAGTRPKYCRNVPRRRRSRDPVFGGREGTGARRSRSDDADALVHAVKTDGKAAFRVAVQFTGEDQARIAEMTVDWHVSMKRNSR